MSQPRRNSGRLLVRSGLLLLVPCLLVAGAWQARWLPTGMQVTLDHFARHAVKAAAPATETPEKIAARPSLAEQKAEQEMLEAGEQFEPAVPQQPQPAGDTPDAPEATTGDDGAQPADESSVPEFPPAGRRRLADRHPVRQTGTVAGDDPFSEPDRNPANRAVANAGFEEPGAKESSPEIPSSAEPVAGEPSGEELPPETQPLAAAKPDPAKPGSAKKNAKVPPPLDGLDEPLPDDLPQRTAKTSPPGTPPADRTALNTSDTSSAKGGALMDMKLINNLIEANDLIAQRELSRWYWKNPASRGQIRKQLEEMAQTLYFSPQPYFQEPYVVQAGDQLRVIAQRYKLSWGYISKLNHVDARKIRMGQKLKVVEGPFSAIVSLGSYELIVHLNGSYVRSYRVGVGKEGTTPTGTFTVKNKLVDPTYYGPDGLVVAHDDPKNPLGERWIDIGDSYGIHGTIDPSSIGKNESRGCIRLLNADVEELYDLLVIGSQVKIQK